MSRYPGPWFAPLSLGDKGWLGPLCKQGQGLTDPIDEARWVFLLGLPTNTSQTRGANFNSDYLLHFHARSLSSNRASLENDFVAKTYHMVDDPDTDKWVSWVDHGQTFVVRCELEFSRDVLPRYMNVEGFLRFIFILSTYGFSFRVRDYEHIEFARFGFNNREGHYLRKGFKFEYVIKHVLISPPPEVLREDPIQKLLPDACPQEFMLKGVLKASAFRCQPRVPLLLVKTYGMVDDPDTDNVVSWGPTGNSFMVWNAQKFYTDLLPAHFKHGNFTRFVLELCAFGFKFRSLKDTVQFEFTKQGFCRGEKQPLRKVAEKDFLRGQRQDLSSAALRKEESAAIGAMNDTSTASRSYEDCLKPLNRPFKRCAKPSQASLGTPLLHDPKIEEDIMELRVEMKWVVKRTKALKGVVMRIKKKCRKRLLQNPSSWESKTEEDVNEVKEGMMEAMEEMEEVMKAMDEIPLNPNMLLD